MNTEEAFRATVIELSIREIETVKGVIVEICMIEANEQMLLMYTPADKPDGTYVLGRTILPRKPLRLDLGCFCLILINCGDHIGCFALAPSRNKEEPSFMMSLMEDGQAVKVDSSDIDTHSKTDFGYSDFALGQRLKIETIPDISSLYEAQGIVENKERS